MQSLLVVGKGLSSVALMLVGAKLSSLSLIPQMCMISTEKPLLALINMMTSHLDIGVLSAVEIFVLTNVTAFIQIHDFLNRKRAQKSLQLSNATDSVRKQSSSGRNKQKRRRRRGQRTIAKL